PALPPLPLHDALPIYLGRKRRQPAPLPCPVEGVRVLTNPFNVKHLGRGRRLSRIGRESIRKRPEMRNVRCGSIARRRDADGRSRSEEHTSELQSLTNL